MTQYNTIQYNIIQYNTIQYNTIKDDKIKYNTIQYNTIQYNMTSRYSDVSSSRFQSYGIKIPDYEYDYKLSLPP